VAIINTLLNNITGLSFRQTLNENFANLNADKAELSVVTPLANRLTDTENDITTLQSDVGQAQSDISQNTTALDTKVDKTSQGILAAATTVVTTQPLTTSYQKIGWVDSVYVNETNGHMAYDNLNKRLVFNTTGIYQIQAQANVAAGNGRELTFKWYRNGVEFETTLPAVYIAKGANSPIPVSDSRVFVATAGDYLEVFAKADSATDLIIKSSGISVIKSCCSVS
jgi:hypothetical protein